MDADKKPEQAEMLSADSAVYKDLTDLNLKAVADDLSEILAKHLGGAFNVSVASFVMLEGAEHPMIDGKFKIAFVVTDQSASDRPASIAWGLL